jgi:hypothetical protein
MVFGGSALLALVLALAARIDVPQTVAATASAGQGRQFDEAWNDVATTVIPKTALLKSDLNVVKTERIEPDTTYIPPIIIAEEKPRKPKYHPVKDVCQRHHMHKVYRGRGWRCRK